MSIGALIQIGDIKHIIVDKFWVGFGMPKCDLTKEYYYEIFSMGGVDGKRRTAIACADFSAGMAEGNIKILSAARKS